MKAITRVLIAMVAAVAGLFVSTGTSNAVLDNEMSLVDGQDRTLTIQQWDTHLEGVFPLDRNRLTREWFHTGRAKYIVRRRGCDEFEGTLELGYQIGFPWSLGVGINFNYTTPNILIDDGNLSGLQPVQLGHYPEPVPGCVDQLRPRQRSRHPGSRDLLGRRGGSGRRCGGLQRARHRDRCGRRCAAASVRPADRRRRVTASPPTANRGT